MDEGRGIGKSGICGLRERACGEVERVDLEEIGAYRARYPRPPNAKLECPLGKLRHPSCSRWCCVSVQTSIPLRACCGVPSLCMRAVSLKRRGVLGWAGRRRGNLGNAGDMYRSASSK